MKNYQGFIAKRVKEGMNPSKDRSILAKEISKEFNVSLSTGYHNLCNYRMKWEEKEKVTVAPGEILKLSQKARITKYNDKKILRERVKGEIAYITKYCIGIMLEKGYIDTISVADLIANDRIVIEVMNDGKWKMLKLPNEIKGNFDLRRLVK